MGQARYVDVYTLYCKHEDERIQVWSSVFCRYGEPALGGGALSYFTYLATYALTRLLYTLAASLEP